MASTHKFVRPLYLMVGICCVGLGYIGAITPLMPSTVFFLIALWAFKKSSPKLEDWILNKSIAGPVLRDWEEDRSMKMSTKILAITMLWISLAVSMAVVISRHRPSWVLAMLATIGIILTLFIATRKTRPASQ